MDVVELAPAYVWVCLRCGRSNGQRAAVRVLDPADEADAAAIRAEYGLEPFDPLPDGAGATSRRPPERVTCRGCGAEFRTVADADFGHEEDDSDD